MSGWFPPNLLRAGLSLVIAAANTPQGVTVIAAPGAGFRHRLWAVSFSCSETGNVPGNQRWVLFSPAGTVIVIRSTMGFDDTDFYWPGGYRCPTNTLVQFQGTSSVVAVEMSVDVFYTTEAV